MLKSGLIGRDILASRSPWLHEQEARALGFELKYELFDFKARGLQEEALGPMLRRLSDEGFSGVNVTFPFKASVMPLLDSIDDGAVLVGAVNTVAMRDGRMVGYNTDMIGFRDSFARDLPGRIAVACPATRCRRGGCRGRKRAAVFRYAATRDRRCAA